MTAKLKHLEFILGVVDRLANNSFRFKRWTVILVSAIFVLIVKEDRGEFAFIGLLPVMIFWGLDGYFLWQERLFRDLYDKVRNLEEKEINFSMETKEFQRTWLGAVFSTTIWPFYLGLIILIGIVIVGWRLTEIKGVCANGTTSLLQF